MATPEPEGMRVTIRDVHALVEATRADVADVKESLHVLADRSGTDRGQLADHESRIRALEERIHALPRAATLIAVASVALSVLGMVHPWSK